MKARQKCPVAGLTTGCSINKAPCIEEKQWVKTPSCKVYSEKQTKKEQIYIYTQPHKCERLCMYIFVLFFVCLSMYVCMRSESESASHSSPPKLKGVRVISACAHARMCAVTISLISLLCLFVCRCAPWHTHTHTHKSNTKNTGKYISRNDRNSTLSLKHGISVLNHEEHTLTEAMKAQQNCPMTGPTTCCRTNQAACIEEKQRVRQPALRYRKKYTQK